jgi:hypothetical protein
MINLTPTYNFCVIGGARHPTSLLSPPLFSWMLVHCINLESPLKLFRNINIQ